MRLRFVTPLLLLVAATVYAHGPRAVYLPITGSVGNFRTDARVFNPSLTQSTTLTATFLPVCAIAGTTPTFQLACGGSPLTSSIVLQPRQMRILNDVVATMFNGTGLGAIKFAAPAEGVNFDVSARIYASVADGTLGQFSQALDGHSTPLHGVFLQLKQNGVAGLKETYRTNVGFMNPSTTASAVVTMTLHDVRGASAGTITLTMPPASVLGPTGIAALFNTTADLSDAWINYSADRSVVGYASVIDNGTSDPTFIPAIPDAGVTTD